MCTVGDRADGHRLHALIVLLWRAGPRISEALALGESDLDRSRSAVLVSRGKGDKGGKRREVGMDRWAWEQLDPWLRRRSAVLARPTRAAPAAPGGMCGTPCPPAATAPRRTAPRSTPAHNGARVGECGHRRQQQPRWTAPSRSREDGLEQLSVDLSLPPRADRDERQRQQTRAPTPGRLRLDEDDATLDQPITHVQVAAA